MGDSASLRRRSVAVAGHRAGDEAARRGLSDGAPEVRATALRALARAQALSQRDVSSALGDPAALVRAAACDLAGGLRMTALAARVGGLLSDPVPSVVEAACYALGEIGPAGPGTDVVALLSVTAGRHKEPLCREAAVAALGALGRPEGLAAVLLALDDRPAIRRRAVVALAAFEGEEVAAALARATTDRDWQVRQAAEDLVGRRRWPD